MEKRLNGVSDPRGAGEGVRAGKGDGCNFARKIEAAAAGETRVTRARAHTWLSRRHCINSVNCQFVPARGGGVNKAPFEVRDPRNPICGSGGGGCGCWEKKR